MAACRLTTEGYLAKDVFLWRHDTALEEAHVLKDSGRLTRLGQINVYRVTKGMKKGIATTIGTPPGDTETKAIASTWGAEEK